MNEVEQIKSRLDIISLIQEYIPLKPAGQNMKGLCPFHEEKTPSFMVHPTRQSFHCFGCGASGDIFSFMQKQENLEFPEALKILAQKAGVELKSYDPARQTLHNKLQEITAAAVVFYEQNLWSDQGQTARQYLIKIRGLEEKIIKQFHLGLAGSNWDGLTKHLRAKGYSFDLLTQSGLVIDKRRPQGLNFFDRFRDRIMFPITNLHGYPVGFTGRLLPQLETKLKTGKYVNTPETPIFRKSHLLFGLAQAKQPIKQAETAIVVEGQMDVLMAHQGQTPNTVAGSGTFLTEAQLGLLKRYTNTIILALDTDQAGEQASLRAVKLVWQQGLEVKIAGLPTTSKDPAELIQQNPAAWQKIIKQATPFLDHYLDVVSSRFDLSTRQGKKSVGQIILPLLVYLTDPIDQSYYTQKLAEQLDVDVKFIQEAFSQAAKKEFSPPRPFKPATIEKKQSISIKDKILSHLLALAIKFPAALFEPLLKTVTATELENDSYYKNFYSQLSLWYNNNKSTDIKGLSGRLDAAAVTLLTELELLADKNYPDVTRAGVQVEFTQLLNRFKKEMLRLKLKQITLAIKTAEQERAPQSDIEKLSKQLTVLTAELRQYDTQ